MIRVLLRLLAALMLLVGMGLVFFTAQPTSTATDNNELKGWLLIVLGMVYFVADFSLKWKADRRAERAEFREVKAPRRKLGEPPAERP